MVSEKENKVLNIMKKAIRFIEGLNDEQIDKIISGDLKLDLKDNNNKSVQIKKKCKEEKIDFEDIVKRINQMTDRNSASQYIEELKFTKDNLILLGEKLGIRIPKKNTKAKAINIIVEKTVGNRLEIEGLRNGIMG